MMTIDQIRLIERTDNAVVKSDMLSDVALATVASRLADLAVPWI